MPINFNTLVTSELELRKMFLNYFQRVILTQEKLAKLISTETKITDEKFEAFKALEKTCNILEAQILDETSWIISKEMPRAGHLRYCIAIIRSIKDVERMGDFAFNVVKYFHSYNVNPKVAKLLSDIANESISVVKVFYKNLKKVRGQTKLFYSRTATKLIVDFSVKYKQWFKQLGQLIFDSDMRLDQCAIGAFTAAKNLERNTDHAFNIIENFTYIGEGNFYFTQESRKGY